MKTADVVTLIFVLLCVGAIILAKRNGKKQFAQAIATAHAQGHAEAMASSVSTSGVVFNNGAAGDAELDAIAQRVVALIGRDAFDSSAVLDGRTLRELGPVDVHSRAVGALQDPARRHRESSGIDRPALVTRTHRHRDSDVQSAQKEITDL